ncbi:MAG: polyprenyl synthetase family protein [Gammaproteobacteria bacterium]|nr:polyprenyl synthetase family protein [Gammaproteobacteria bacterium]MYF57506.1 polyprenyl synthetase family protein [Gammaproteobacteria bacterium]MYH34970.1 polyprenyl synthetase family protein [Gammaproteobacteria bacterium]
MDSSKTFEQRRTGYQARANALLERVLPSAATTPGRLHGAMREAVLRGGKRLRPLVCYAAAEAAGVPDSLVDAPAVAIELIHCYSLVHDDMPCMDDDDFRRGKPSIHKMYGEDTALLVGDALQTLAWQVLATHSSLNGHDGARVRLIGLLTECAGSAGMAGGQDLDLNGGDRPDLAELEHAYRTKTGALFRAAALAPACVRPDLGVRLRHSLEIFADALGLAFQIRDDLADRDSDQRQQPQGGGANLPSWVQRFGAQAAQERIGELTAIMRSACEDFEDRAGGLQWLIGFMRGTHSASTMK